MRMQRPLRSGRHEALVLPRSRKRPADEVPYLALALHPLPVVEMLARPADSAAAFSDAEAQCQLWKDCIDGLKLFIVTCQYFCSVLFVDAAPKFVSCCCCRNASRDIHIEGRSVAVHG